jgi:hypothetical protein
VLLLSRQPVKPQFLIQFPPRKIPLSIPHRPLLREASSVGRAYVARFPDAPQIIGKGRQILRKSSYFRDVLRVLEGPRQGIHGSSVPLQSGFPANRRSLLPFMGF